MVAPHDRQLYFHVITSCSNHSDHWVLAMSEKRNYALLAALLVLISLFALAARSLCKAFALWSEILSFMNGVAIHPSGRLRGAAAKLEKTKKTKKVKTKKR